MPVGLGSGSMGFESLSLTETQQTLSSRENDSDNGKVTIFASITSSASDPAHPAAVTNGDGGVDIVAATGDHVQEIPISSCYLEIAKILEKHKKASSLTKVSVAHRKVTQFLETVMTSPTTKMEFILATLISSPHYIDILLCHHLFLDKVFSAFKNDHLADTGDEKKMRASMDPSVIRNILCLVYKIQEHVLKELDLDVTSLDYQDELWDCTEPADDFMSYFTKGASGMSTSLWFISNIEITNVAEFFLQLIKDFHNKADFTVMVNRWLIEGSIVIKLIEALGDIRASHDNITLVLLGLLDLTGQSASNKQKGYKAVTALAEHFYCRATLTCLVASTQSLLKHPTLTLRADQGDMRTNGIKCCFQILSKLLQMDQYAVKGYVTTFASSSCSSVGQNSRANGSKSKVFRNPRVNINSVIVDSDFMTALGTTLEVGGPKTYLHLTSYGTAPFGILRRSILGFIHDLVLHTDGIGLLVLLEYNQIFEYLLKYLFWLHPLNTFIHLKICSIVQALLNSGIAEAANVVILQNNFIEASLEFLKKAKPSGLQKPFIMKMLGTLVDCSYGTVSACSVTNALEKWGKANPQLKEDWDALVLIELPYYQQKQNVLLGGVPKPVKGKDSSSEDSVLSSEDDECCDDDDDDGYSDYLRF